MTDLFGADLPVEGGQGGQFAWRDGPLLRALKAGHWIVLDEVCTALNCFINEFFHVSVSFSGTNCMPESTVL